jgi:hypothetical protein
LHLLVELVTFRPELHVLTRLHHLESTDDSCSRMAAVVNQELYFQRRLSLSAE